ncbi:MAG: GAF domain-containing protein [Chloroflexi bacterium]|nr:GAF domain-containing protein [Chloroflexota bacterium]MCI0649013.1 GAF domain-containing protein [Chloroflexota bacterium]MCI0729448.1 GAF domain-containing protein [Chloroflexota bacterium]
MTGSFSSIRARILLGSVLLLGLALGGTAIGYLSLRNAHQNTQNTLQQAYRIRELSLTIDNEFLLARASETAFLSTWRTVGFEAASAEHVSANEEHLNRAQVALDTIEELGNTITPDIEPLNHLREDVAELRPLLDEYKEAFQTTVDSVASRAAMSGQEDVLQQTLDDLANKTATLSNPELYQLTLQIRANEQAFFNTGQQEYADNIRLLLDRFKSNVAASEPGDLVADGQQLSAQELTGQADSYFATFNELVALEQEFDVNVALFREVTAEINALTEHMGEDSNESLALITARLETTRNRNLILVGAVTLLLLGLGPLAVLFYSGRIIQRLTRLSQAAREIGQGNLAYPIEGGGPDELAVLAQTFRDMAGQLHTLVGSLEAQVTGRTRDLALAAEIGRGLSRVRDLEQLMAETVELVRSRFDLYYTQIYLADATGRNLTLRAGTGLVGAELARRGHRLAISAGSINGVAALERQIVVVEDTTTSDIFRPNPLLPDTRSEMAIPLLVGEHVVGVLDLQSDEPGVFSTESVPAFEALAGQLAVAIENARLFSETIQARSALEAQARRLAYGGWEAYLNAIERGEHLGYSYDRQTVALLEKPLAPAAGSNALSVPIAVAGAQIGLIQVQGQEGHYWTEEESQVVTAVARQVAQQVENLRLLAEADRFRSEAEQATRQLTREGWTDYLHTQGQSESGYLYNMNQVQPLPAETNGRQDAQPAITQPLSVRGEPVGQVEVAGIEDPEVADLVAAVTERLGAHLENLRLSEETTRALRQTQALYNASRALLGYENLADLLQAVVDSAVEALPADRVTLTTLDTEREQVINWVWGGAVEHRDQVSYSELMEGLTGWVLQEHRPALSLKGVPDLREGSKIRKRRQKSNSGSVIVVPLRYRDEFLGTMTAINRPEQRDFIEEDVNTMVALANQAATAITNLRLFEQTQQALAETSKRAEELSVINQVIQAVSQQLELDQLLETVYQQVKRIMPADAFIVGLYDVEQDLISYPLIYDEGIRYQEPPTPPTRDSKIFEVIQKGQPYLRHRTREEMTQNPDQDDSTALGNASKVSLSMLFVPLQTGTQKLGVLSIQSYKYDAYTEADLTLLGGIANHVAIALNNAQLFHQTQAALAETEEQALRLGLLNELGQALTAANNLESVYRVASQRTHQIVQSDRTNITLLNPSGTHYTIVAHGGEKSTTKVGDTIPVAGSTIETAAREARVVVVNQAQDSHMPGILSFMVAPLLAGGRVIGTLNVGNKKANSFTTRDERLLFQVASLLASTIESRQLFAQTQERAEELAVINRVAQTVSQQIEPKQLLEAVYEQIQRIMPADAFFVGIYNDATGFISYPLIYDDGQRYENTPDVLPLGSVTHEVIVYGRPAILNRTPEEVAALQVQKPDTTLGDQEKISASLLYVPLQVGVEISGVLSIQSYQYNAYDQADVTLLTGIANHVAVALENARLFQQTQAALAETEERAEELAVINRVAQSVSQQLDEEQLLESVYEQIQRIMSADAFFVALHDPKTDIITYPLMYDEGQRFNQSPTTMSPRGQVSQVIRSGELILVLRTAEEVARVEKERDLTFLGNVERVSASLLYVPLRIGARTFGVLSVQSYSLNAYDQADVALLSGIANHVAVALENARLFQQTQVTLAETAVLYQASAELNAAQSYDDVLDVLRRHTIAGQAVSNVSVMFFNHPWTEGNSPDWADVLAYWDAVPSDSLKLRYPLKDYPSALEILHPEEPTIIDDIVQDPRLDERLRNLYVRGLGATSTIFVPMVVAGQWIGYVNAIYPQKPELSDEAIRRLTTLARQAAVAVQGLRNLTLAEHRAQEAQRRSEELAVLNEMGRQLTALVDVDAVVESIYQFTARLMDATNFYVAFYDHKRDEISFALDIIGERVRWHSGKRRAGQGLTEYLIRSRRPLLLEKEVDLRLAELGIQMIGPPAESWLGVPMIAGNQVIGVIGVQSYTAPLTYNEHHLELLTAVASQAAIAIENARLFGQTQTRAEELAVLNEMSRELTASLEVNTIINHVYNYASRLMDTTNFYIALYDADSSLISFPIATQEGQRVNWRSRPFGEGMTEYLVKSRKPLLITEKVEERLKELGLASIGMQAESWAGTPMLFGEQVIGAIAIQHPQPHLYDEHHIELLNAVASQAVIALENARLFTQVQARARRERILREVTARVRSATDVDTIMRTAVQEVGQALGRQTFVYLGDGEPAPSSQQVKGS